MKALRSSSLILRTTGQFLLPLLLLFSVFLLLRGHHAPGGGFIAGLVASAAIALHLFAADLTSARAVLRADPRAVLGVGLLVALVAAFIGPLTGGSFFEGVWVKLDLGGLGKLEVGTPLLFDTGVYFVVIGAVLTIVLSLAEDD